MRPGDIPAARRMSAETRPFTATGLGTSQAAARKSGGKPRFIETHRASKVTAPDQAETSGDGVMNRNEVAELLREAVASSRGSTLQVPLVMARTKVLLARVAATAAIPEAGTGTKARAHSKSS